MNTSFTEKYGQWAVVTGASSGIGKEFARQLRKKGLKVALIARSEDQLRAVAELLGEDNTRVIATNLATQEGIDTLEEKTSDLDIGLFVHSAGAVHLGPFIDIKETDIDELLNVHVTATTNLAHIFANRMKARKKAGGLVLVSSGFALTPVPWIAIYSATKAYVLSLGEALSVELKDHNIDVLTVVPGGTKTNMAIDIEKHLDLKKIPLPMGSAATVASTAIKSLGKRDSVVPGVLNKMMAVMMDKLMSRNASKNMIGWMIKKAFRKMPEKRSAGAQS